MPCLLALSAFFFPRLVMVILVIFSDYIGNAFATVLWPLLGFFLMPYTTLAYAWAINANGSVDGLYLAVVVFAVLADLGVSGGGAKSRRTRVVVTERRRVRR